MRKDHLTKYEQETIYNYNRGEAEGTIFTYDPKLKRRLKKFATRYPQCARLEYENGQGGVSYVVDRRRVSLRFSAPYTEERVQKAREYVKINAQRI